MKGRFTSRAWLENISVSNLAVAHRVHRGHNYSITVLECALGGWGKIDTKGSRACVEPLAVAEVGDVESPEATEAGHCSYSWAALERPALWKKGELFPCPWLAASRKPSQGMREHWIKYQQTPIGGQFPERQIFLGPSVSYRLILNLGTCPGLPVLFQYVTLTSAVEEGTSSPALCHAPQLCTCVIDEPRASSFSVHRASREAGPRCFPSCSVEARVLRPWVFCPVSLSSFPLLSWCLGIKPSVLCMSVLCCTTELHPQPVLHPALWCLYLCFFRPVLT